MATPTEGDHQEEGQAEKRADGKQNSSGDQHGQREADDPSSVDPFCLDLDLRPWDWLKILFGTVVILPWRAVLILLIILTAWLVCKVGLLGVDDDALKERPLQGWRRKVFSFYSYFGK
jgi:hypothetical protein